MDGTDRIDITVDAFHRGAFYLVQPKGKGHRAGLDAMLLSATVPDNARGHLADFGAGAGAAGLAAASRIPSLRITLVERSDVMVEFARRSLDLPQNVGLAARVDLLKADVALSGTQRIQAGLPDRAFDYVIMNPPFNDRSDRRTPDPLKAEAHAMDGRVFPDWVRTAGAVMRPAGQLSLIARPQPVADILEACRNRFGGLHLTPVHARPGEDAFRLLVTAIKGSRARLSLRPALHVHEAGQQTFSTFVDDLNNGRACIRR